MDKHLKIKFILERLWWFVLTQTVSINFYGFVKRFLVNNWLRKILCIVRTLERKRDSFVLKNLFLSPSEETTIQRLTITPEAKFLIALL
jgi:hypothetical protein